MLASDEKNAQRIRVATLIVPLPSEHEQLPRVRCIDDIAAGAFGPRTRQNQTCQACSSRLLNQPLRLRQLLPQEDEPSTAAPALVTPLAQCPDPLDSGARP